MQEENLTLDAAQSIQPFAHGSTLIRTSPSTRSGWLSCGESTGTLRRMIQPTHWSTAGAAAGKLLAKGRQNKMKTKWGAPVPGSQWPFQSLAQSWLPARPYSIELLALRD